MQKAVLKNFMILAGKQLGWSLFSDKAADLQICNFIKKALSCEYHEISKNTYCEKQLQMVASEFSKIIF